MSVNKEKKEQSIKPILGKSLEETASKEVKDALAVTKEDEKTSQEEVKEEKAPEPMIIPLTEKQVNVLNKLTSEKNRIQQEFNKIIEKENDILIIVMEFKGIDGKKVQGVNLTPEGDGLIIQLKK